MATDTLPIVLMTGSEPVGLGLVRSLARPGGNITGVADLDVELAPKRLEIFRELVPDLKRVLFAYDADDRRDLPAQRLSPRLSPAAHHPGRAAGAHSGGSQDGTRRRAEGRRRPHVVAAIQGGLASDAANYDEIGRQASRLVDTIIKGKRPADIPSSSQRDSSWSSTVGRRGHWADDSSVDPAEGRTTDRIAWPLVAPSSARYGRPMQMNNLPV